MSTTELERRPLTPLDIGETKAAQKLYQDGLVQLLDRAADLTPIRGQGGKVKNHVNRSGVSKITTWCSLSTTLVGEPTIDRDEDGKALRWRVAARRRGAGRMRGRLSRRLRCEETPGSRNRSMTVWVPHSPGLATGRSWTWLAWVR